MLCEEHSDTLISMLNLASIYSSQERWKEAEELQMEVMKKTKSVLGEEHPLTLTSMDHRAFTWEAGNQDKRAVVENLRGCCAARKCRED